MFKKLFGSSSESKKPVEVSLDPHNVMGNLDDQIDKVQKRSKVVDNQIKALKIEAVQKKQQKDTRCKWWEEEDEVGLETTNNMYQILLLLFSNTKSLTFPFSCNERHEKDEDDGEGDC
jgi:hypothetical protein